MTTCESSTSMPLTETQAPLNPAARLTGAIIASVAMAILTRPESCLLAMLLGLVLFTVTGTSLAHALRRLLLANVFIAFLWLTVPFSVAGEALYSVGPFTLTHEGLLLALTITLKSNAMLLVFFALVAFLPLPQLGAALSALHCPRRLTTLLLVTYRYVHVLSDEWHTLRTSAMLRGFEPKTNLATYKTYAMLTGLLFIRSWDRSLRIWEAMRLRSFSGHYPTGTLAPLNFRDVFFLAGLLVFLTLLCLYDFFPEVFCAAGRLLP